MTPVTPARLPGSAAVVVLSILAAAGSGAALGAGPASGAIADTGVERSAASKPTPSAPPGERVIASGPGYSIAAAGPASPSPGASDESDESARPASNLPVEHRHDPIVCQGARLLHIDSRNLVFDGTAVRVEQGCELHITNSTIRAKGVGIAARDASVHIDNSFIQGGGGAVDASDGAQVYARSSTFKGLIRRNGKAAFHDLGGNVGD